MDKRIEPIGYVRVVCVRCVVFAGVCDPTDCGYGVFVHCEA